MKITMRGNSSYFTIISKSLLSFLIIREVIN